MQKVIRLLKEFFKDPTVLPPPCHTVDRDPYSKQYEYIARVANQG
jgi:hypothetical protein